MSPPLFAPVRRSIQKSHEAGWRNPRHAQQRRRTLLTYAYPFMGDLPVVKVDTPHVLAVLEPLWRTKPETASRLRGRVEAAFDYSKGRAWGRGGYPAPGRRDRGPPIPPTTHGAPSE